MVGEVDVLYQDVAQRDQASIFLRNAPLLKAGGGGILMVKARSVDVAASPSRVYSGEVNSLASGGLRVLSVTTLGSYQKDHAAIIVQR